MNAAHEHVLQRLHLQIIVEVERRGSLTAAADALSLTQSALSHSIKKLEKQLGALIWVRDAIATGLNPALLYATKWQSFIMKPLPMQPMRQSLRLGNGE